MNQGLDALMSALKKWNGGVIIISHDERFITTVANQANKLFTDTKRGALTYYELQLWVCGDGTVKNYKGDVQSYKASSYLTLIFRCLTSFSVTYCQ